MNQMSGTQQLITFIIIICLVNIMVAVLEKRAEQKHYYYGSGEVSINAIMYCAPKTSPTFLWSQKLLKDNLCEDIEIISNQGDSVNVNITTVSAKRFEDPTGSTIPGKQGLAGLSKRFNSVPYVYEGRNIYFHHVEHFYGTPEEYGYKPNSVDFIIFAGCEKTGDQQLPIDGFTVLKYKDMLKPEGMLIITAGATKNRQVLNLLASEFTTLKGVGDGNFYQKITTSIQRRPVKEKESACSVM
jgi:hypothetical protein